MKSYLRKVTEKRLFHFARSDNLYIVREVFS
nr:MAG TPA: hypothetical protein [Bacteriophage sp.]